MPRWNFPHERIPLSPFEGKGYPTVMVRPDWDTWSPPPRIRVGPFNVGPPPRLGGVRNIKIALVGDYNERGLMSAPSLPDAPATLSFGSFKSHAEGMAPITEPDIVEWMHYATACEIIAEQMEEEYKRAGSYVVATSGDPYIPGVNLEDMSFRSETGEVVASRGVGVIVTPRGNFDCPVPGKATGVFQDILAWGAILNAWMVQWTGILTKWLNLATNPQSRIRFPNYNGLVGPQFIGHEADAPSPVNFVRMKVSTDRAQTMKVKYREPSDYTQQIASVDLSLSKGQNDVTYELFAFPFVPTMAVELQPEDGTQTILDSYSPSALPV